MSLKYIYTQVYTKTLQATESGALDNPPGILGRRHRVPCSHRGVSQTPRLDLPRVEVHRGRGRDHTVD